MATTQGQMRFYHGASSENTFVLHGDGPVQLYHDNTSPATTTCGITISDQLNVAGIATIAGDVVMNVIIIGTTTEGSITADDLQTSGDTGITVRSGTSNSGKSSFLMNAWVF